MKFAFTSDSQVVFGAVAAMICWVAGASKIFDGNYAEAAIWFSIPFAIYVFFGLVDGNKG